MEERRYVRSIRWQMTAGVLALSLGSALGVGSLAWAQGPLDEERGAEGGFSSLGGDVVRSVCRPCEGALSFTGKVLAAGVEKAARARRSLAAEATAFKQRAEGDAGGSAGNRTHDEAGTAALGEDEGPGSAADEGLDSATDARTEGTEADKSKTEGADQGAAPSATGSSGTSNVSITAEEAASDGASTEPQEAPNSESPTSCPEKVAEPEEATVPEEAPPTHTPSPAPNDGEHAGKTPCTLTIGGTIIPYCDVRGGTTPSTGGGLWRGSDAVDDGSWGYFVGHNPGSFAPVRLLGPGDAVIVCDNAGAERTYTVRDVFIAEADATWKTIADRVTSYGESIALQTCNDDGSTITIVVAT